MDDYVFREPKGAGIDPTVAAALRAQGLSWGQIARRLRERFRVGELVSARLARGWSQATVAEQWNGRWPTEPKTATNVRYWENSASADGYPPSRMVLARLATIYGCSVDDLQSDHVDSQL